MRAAISKAAVLTMEITMTIMNPSPIGCAWPPRADRRLLVYVSLVKIHLPLSLSLPSETSSVRRGCHRDDLVSGEELLVHDEREREEVQRDERHEGDPHLPLLACRPLVGNPASYRRQPQNHERKADGENLVEALVEDRITITLRPIEGVESVEQPQVNDDQRPECVRHTLHALPVLPECLLQPGIRGNHHWHGQKDDEEPGQKEGMPGDSA